MPVVRRAIHPNQAALWRSLDQQYSARIKALTREFDLFTRGVLTGLDVDCPGDAKVVLDAEKPEVVYSWPDIAPKDATP